MHCDIETTVPWDKTIGLIDQLVGKIRAVGFMPDYVGAVPRGGWTVAALIAQRLGVKQTVSFDIDKTSGIPIVQLAAPLRILGKKVLVIEDSLETGATIDAVKEVIIRHAPECIKTAAIFICPRTHTAPDFYVGMVKNIPDFPWDIN